MYKSYSSWTQNIARSNRSATSVCVSRTWSSRLVGRTKSIKGAGRGENAGGRSRYFCLTQRDSPPPDEPTGEDLFDYGCIAKSCSLNYPTARFGVLVEGPITRAITGLLESVTACMEAEIEQSKLRVKAKSRECGRKTS